MVCPKNPVALSRDLTRETWDNVLELKNVVCSKLAMILHCTGYNFAWNEGSVAGQTVPHFHLHILPRKKEDSGITCYEPRVFLYRPGNRADSPEEELLSLAKILRECYTQRI